jgi:hypothetical protein
MVLSETNSLFTYSERVDNACQSFLKLKDKYIFTKDCYERYGRQALQETLGDFIARDWQVERLDMDERLWELKNKK